ncbi:MAG TPA: ABC transporter ATP-binding protein [Acidimicrobiia bacterium]|nr:ABC transporter ATP-binding protein [Acidimicrobiia bacterium]
MNAQSEGAGRSLLRRGVHVLRRFISMHPLPFATAVTGSVVYAGMSVAGATVLGRVTDKVITPAFDSSKHLSYSTAWFYGFLVVLVALLRGAGVVTRRYFAAMTARRSQVSLRLDVTDKYIDVPLEFHRAHPTGELMAHADIDVEASTEVVHPLPFSIGLIVLILFSVVELFVIDPVLAIVGLLLFPAMFVLNRSYTRRVERPAAMVQERVGEVSAIAHESFDGALAVKTLGLEALEKARLADAADRLRAERIEVGKLRAFFEPSLDAMPNLGSVAILAVGGWRVSQGAVTPGQLVTVMLLFTLLAFPMRVVGFLLEELPRSVVSIARVDRILAALPAVRPAKPLPLPAGALSVSAEAVGFAYPGSDPVITGCSFAIAPGAIVALVGATGSGKSTLCDLVAGLVAPDQGVVRIGGVDGREVAPAELRGAVSLVFQESFLFADHIGDNITVGSDADLAARDRAAEIAQAADFIAELPGGYDTIVGERGVTLSGGQRQRVALARALVRRPRLLILDDATSAVDPTVEARILGGLRDELDMTTLVVAHRLSTIALADHVLFLRGGAIAATGTHVELLDVPEYAALVSAYEQASDEGEMGRAAAHDRASMRP